MTAIQRCGNPWRLLAMLIALVALGGGAWWWLRSDSRLAQAESALLRHDYATARAVLDVYLEERADDPAARLLAARACRGLHDYGAALEHLNRCRAARGDAGAIEVETALISLEQGSTRSLSWLRERAQLEDPVALVTLEALIQHDIDTYQLRQAQQDLNEYLRRRPGDLHALLTRGFVWERFLSFADAVVDYRTAVQYHPNSDLARLRLADTLLIAGTPAEALEQYQWLAASHPEQLEVRLGLARCHRRLGDLALAVQMLDSLAKDFPKHGETLLERGLLGLDLVQAADAALWLERAFTVLPYDRRVSYALERCLTDLGRPDEAAKYRDHTARLDEDLRRLDQLRLKVMERPGDAALRCEVGILFIKNGERHEGLRWLQTALHLDPGCDAARQALLFYKDQ